MLKRFSKWWHGRHARQIRRRAGFRKENHPIGYANEFMQIRAINGFGRDARNDPPEAGATNGILKTRHEIIRR
jgi:hypothetical protein